MVNEYAEKMSKRVEKLYYSRFECRSEQEVVSNLKELTEIAEEIEMEIFQELTPKAKEIIQEIQKE